MGVAEVRREHAVAPVEHAGRPGRPGGREQRGLDPGPGRAAGMQPLRGGAVAEELEQAGRERAGDAERPRGRRGIEPEQPRRRDRRAEHPADARGVEPAPVELAVGGGPDPRHGLAPGHVGGNELRAARAGGGGHRQRRGGDHGRDVADRRRVGVVVVQCVHQRAVRERRARCREPDARPDHGRRGGAALGDRDGARLGPLVERRRGVRAADGVQHVHDGPVADRRRHVVVSERDGEGRESLRRGHRELDLEPGRLVRRAECDIHRDRLADLRDDRAERDPGAAVGPRHADRRGAVAEQRARVGARGDPRAAGLEGRLAAPRALDLLQLARHARIDIGARQRVVRVEEPRGAVGRHGGATGAALEADRVAAGIDHRVVLAGGVRDRPDELGCGAGRRPLQRAAQHAGDGQAVGIVPEHAERVHADPDAVARGTGEADQASRRQHRHLAAIGVAVAEQHLAAVHRQRQVHGLRDQRGLPVAGRHGEGAALRAQRLRVPPLLVEEVVREHLLGRDAGALRDPGELLEERRRVGADRPHEVGVGEELLDVPRARQARPDRRIVKKSAQRRPHLASQRLAVLSPPLGRVSLEHQHASPLRRRHGRKSRRSPRKPRESTHSEGRLLSGCRAGYTLAVRVREPWLGRGGCLGAGRAEPPLEGNWMKTGWKKTIAPLVLVARRGCACGLRRIERRLGHRRRG